MSDELVLLSNLIEEKTGLFFCADWGLETLRERLKPRLEKNGLPSFSEYCRFLREEKTAADEWRDLIAALSKPVTTFIRHRNRARVLVDTVLPRWIADTNSKTLKIWSAGCATGEEPLWIAMALCEAGWFDRLEIGIDASDANFVALETARQGIYGETQSRLLPDEWREKYFTSTGKGFQVKPQLHQRVRWSLANLMDENEVAGLASSDIIFCRNVFIYFSDAAILQTLHLFAKKMPAGGYLFTDEGDHFESLMSQINVFEQLKVTGATVWMKARD